MNLILFFASVGAKEYYNKSGRPLHREGDALCRVCFFLRVEFLSLIENLFFSGLLYKVHFLFLSIIRRLSSFLSIEQNGENPVSGLQNFCTFDGFYLACEGGGGVDHIVNVASRYTDMLEVVDMTADVHIYVVLAQDAVYAFSAYQAARFPLLGCRHRWGDGRLR